MLTYLHSVNFCLYSPFLKFWHYVLRLNCDFANTSEIDYMKIILHGIIFMLLCQFIFSNLTHFQCARNIDNFFWISLDKGLKKSKKGFLIFRHFFRRFLNFFLCSVVYIWRDFFLNSMSNFNMNLVLFSFCFNSHKTNYVWKECKKESMKSHWLNNVRLKLISRIDLCASKSPCL